MKKKNKKKTRKKSRKLKRRKKHKLSKKTTIYVGQQDSKTEKIIKQILTKNPSKKVFYGNAWTLKKVNDQMVYSDKKGELILKSKKIFSNGIWQNVGLAIKVARDFNISNKNILKTIPKLFFEGRLQYITKGRLRKLLYFQEKLLIDGCHSEVSGNNLASYLKTLNKDIYGIWGMQTNKHPEKFIKHFKGIFKEIIAVKIPDEINASNPKKLQKIANRFNIKCSTAPNIRSAILQLSSKKEKVITCFGSLYLVGKVLSLN